MILTGSEDGLIPPELLAKIQAKMIDKDNHCDVVIHSGDDHGFFDYGRQRNELFKATMGEMEDFLNSVFD